MRSKFGTSLRGLITGAALAVLPAAAADFRLAVSSPTTSMDPHYQNLIPNLALHQHVFETLVGMDANSRIQPVLAESLKPLSDTVWELKLRRGVKFHDGSELAADDVVWSLERPPTVVRSPASFTIYTRSIAEKRIIDPHTIHLVTKEPYPLLPNDLGQVFMLSRKSAEGMTTEDMNQGRGAVGTGPYKLVSYRSDDRAELARNEAYWGQQPAWDKVTYRFITAESARTAALLAGDVDAIDTVPSADLPRIRADQKLVFAQKPSLRVIYFYLDSGRDAPPGLTGKDGQPLPKNPFKDARVRKALSMALNREAIRDRIMEGTSFPSSHIVPPSLRADDPGFALQPYDPEGAKRLLAEAGYPEGFRVTLSTPNNRFPNDEKITQSVAQMLTRIGVQAGVEAMPMAVYGTRGAKGDFGIGLIGWGAQTGEVSSTLRAIIACESKEHGWGAFNWSRYCNPAVDEALARALKTMDEGERSRILREAAKTAANDGAVIPIHFQSTTWAARRGIEIEPRSDERSLAMSFRPARAN
jgi:peptide/nickel transport system substrate-binding protein